MLKHFTVRLPQKYCETLAELGLKDSDVSKVGVGNSLWCFYEEKAAKPKPAAQAKLAEDKQQQPAAPAATFKGDK